MSFQLQDVLIYNLGNSDSCRISFSPNCEKSKIKRPILFLLKKKVLNVIPVNLYDISVS